ncbi:MAG TPA: response regulator transcription factor [Actinomycetes bacterium]
MRPTVLIVDDHAAFRTSARALLQAEGFDVIGEATDGAEAVAAVAVMRPEIVLLDIQLPDVDGLAVAEQLAMAPDPPTVVLISSRDAAAYGARLRSTSARGFIPKSGLSGEALAALTG